MQESFEQVEEVVRGISFLLATGVEGIAALVVGLAVLEATWRSARVIVRQHHMPETEKLAVRLKLGRWLAISLEILLAADILRTAIAPTWEEIGKLAAIAAIRTVLNYFLEREVETTEARAHGPQDPRSISTSGPED